MTSDTPVLVVDDHAVMGHALAMALTLQGVERSVALPADRLTDDEVLAAAADAGEGLVVLLDLHLGDDRMSTPMIPALRALALACWC